MLFNSFNFMIFFPIVVLTYFIIPKNIKHIWLLLCSYYFYMCWNPKYAVLMFISTTVTYLSGIFIEKAITKKKKKMYVFLSLIINLGILFFFKYTGFIIENLNLVLEKINFSLINREFDIILPVGISFYTFQALSYTIDVYRKEIAPQKNFAKYALFVSFFPQLVAGPIERSKNLLKQINTIENRSDFEYSRIKSGLLLMMWGFFQKLVIADRIAILVNEVYNNIEKYKGFQIIVATVFFGIQIYCDFSSYSTIAVGTAKILGFDLMQNFRQPYFSTSVAEFWRRWHISLSTWFKDYLYFPLGGSKVKKYRRYLNILIVFVLSGLWHGANWTFIVWGFLNGMYQILGFELKGVRDYIVRILHIERTTFSHKIFKIITTFMLINFSWLFFRANSITDAILAIKNIFSTINLWIFVDGSIYLLGLSQIEFWIAIFGIFILFIVDLLKYNNIQIRDNIATQSIVFRWVLYLGIIYFIMILGI